MAARITRDKRVIWMAFSTFAHRSGRTEQRGVLVVRPVVLLKQGADGLEHGRVQVLEYGQGIAPAGKGGGQTGQVGQPRPTTAGGNRRLGAWRSCVPRTPVGLTGQRVGQRHDLPHRLR